MAHPVALAAASWLHNPMVQARKRLDLHFRLVRKLESILENALDDWGRAA